MTSAALPRSTAALIIPSAIDERMDVSSDLIVLLILLRVVTVASHHHMAAAQNHNHVLELVAFDPVRELRFHSLAHVRISVLDLHENPDPSTGLAVD